jgi:uncharacterized protein
MRSSFWIAGFLNIEMNYVYLHGFASGPESVKAQFLRSRFAEQGITLHVPDLNLGDFATVTLTKQLQYLQDCFAGDPLVAIGSSLGGLLASLLASTNAEVEKLVLLAPAFGFSQRLVTGLGEAAIARWLETGSLDYYHYGLKQVVPLRYEFFADAQSHTEKSLQRELPILIMHGINDEVVPAIASQTFADTRPHVMLELLHSDHSLGDVLEPIWQKIGTFLNIG